jgi:DNA polymerase I-like protein with 3'-5' exonuclease and polymerase domains
MAELPLLYEDNLLHPTYSTMLTSTFRLSSSGPNIQNQPKRKHKEIRQPIHAPPVYIMMACDEGQLEARVYGMASQDRALCQSIIDKEDIHTYWLNKLLGLYPEYINRLAEKVNQTDETKIRRYGRDIIKTDFVFASLFGTTAANCSERTSVPLYHMQNLLDEFWERYPEARSWLKARKKEYEDTGGVRTLTGKFRSDVLPGQEAINTPIQSSAADLVLDAQNELSQYAFEVQEMDLHPRLNVHDDLTFWIRDQEDHIEACAKRIAEAMTRVRYKFQIVPLSVEIKIGYNWTDMEEIAVLTGDYVK